MKGSVIDELFDLKVGNERVALQDNLFSGENYFDSHKCFSGINFQENRDIIIDNYRRSKEMSKIVKEQRGTALMVVAAFHDILGSSPRTS